MNKLSLRFRNQSLENDYRRNQVRNHFRYFSSVQGLLILMSFTFMIRLVIEQNKYLLVGSCGFLMAFFSVCTWVGFQKNLAWMHRVLFVENIALCLYEVVFLIKAFENTSKESLFHSSVNQNYIFGFFIGVINISMINNPDFPQCVIQIICIMVAKTVIGSVIGFSELLFLIPFSAVNLLHLCYIREKESRISFIRGQQNKSHEFIINEGFQDLFLHTLVNFNDRSVDFINCNKKFRQIYYVKSSITLRTFLRMTLVQKKSGEEIMNLEQWIWKRAKKYQENNKIVFKGQEAVIQCIYQDPERDVRQVLEVRVLMNNIDKLECILFFEDIGQYKSRQEIINKFRHQIAQIMTTVRKQNQITNQIFQITSSLLTQTNLEKIIKQINRIRYKCFLSTNVLNHINQLDHSQSLCVISLRSFTQILFKADQISNNFVGTMPFVAKEIPSCFCFSTSIPLALFVHISIMEYIRKTKSRIHYREASVVNAKNKQIIGLKYLFNQKHISQTLEKRKAILINNTIRVLKIISDQETISIDEKFDHTQIYFRLIDLTE